MKKKFKKTKKRTKKHHLFKKTCSVLNGIVGLLLMIVLALSIILVSEELIYSVRADSLVYPNLNIEK